MGCDYNPEQWPRETWAEDVRLMREAGVTFVTRRRSSPGPCWSRPRGRFDFGWLDEVLGPAARRRDRGRPGHRDGIAAAVAVADRTPRSCRCDRRGHRLWPGSRQAWCPSSPVVPRARAPARPSDGQAVRRPSRRSRCGTCPTSSAATTGAATATTRAAAFREWLRRRYGTVGRLNDAWGTAFWSQHYGDWDEILPPRVAPRRHPTRPSSSTSSGSPPTQLLDHLRAERDVLHG